jgi:hypothetical protein
MRIMRFLAITLVAVAVVASGLTWLVGSKLIAPATHKVARPENFNSDVVAISSRTMKLRGGGPTLIRDYP